MKKFEEIRRPRILIEGVVIVASILLALAADAWWDGVQEREEERKVLSAIRAEFEMNLENLAQTGEYHRRALTAMQTVVSASRSDSVDAEVSEGAIFVSWVVATPHYNPATGALAATIGSGQIGLIRNVELRHRLAGWDAIISDLMIDEQTRRDFVNHELLPVLAEFGIGGGYLTEQLPTADIHEALKSRLLLAYLNGQIDQISHLLTHFDDAEAATHAMIADLSKELGSL
jgi:hypothetical protein